MTPAARRRALLLALLLTLSLAAACTQSSAGGGSREIVLRFWAMGREGEVVAELVPEFEKANPGIRVKVQQRFHALTGDLPPRRATWQYPALANDVYARAFREQLERVKPAPKVPEWERIATEIRLVAERAAHGEISVDQAVRLLDARAARILEKRRWLLARRSGE